MSRRHDTLFPHKTHTHARTHKNRRSAGRCEGGVGRPRPGGFSGSQGSSQRDRIASTEWFFSKGSAIEFKMASASARRRWIVSMFAQRKATGWLDGGGFDAAWRAQGRSSEWVWFR